MDTDVPLIEIAVEDDSLIQQSPSAAGTSVSTPTNCLFSCSPLQILASSHRPPRNSDAHNFMNIKNKGDITELTGSSATGNGNKENININISELPKLSVEPQQMKRRKKGSEYNLQKSLAWDKAFSTDEGFLNALELSMLGGSNVDSRNSWGRVEGTPKVISNQTDSRPGLKCGCPRSPAFSSLKRPANSSITKAGLKESKLPKLPVSKMGAQSLYKFSKSSLPSSSQTKHNQTGREDILKGASSRSSSKTTKTISSKHKSGSHCESLSEKSPPQHPRKNKVQENSEKELISVSNLQPRETSLTNRVNFRLEASTVVLPPTGSHTAVAHKVGVKHGILSENVNVLATMAHTEIQKKPSGLRMPSPSMGFFSQPKYSGSVSFSRAPTQSINAPGSCVPNSHKLSKLNTQYDSRLPNLPGKLVTKVEDNLSSKEAEIQESSLESVATRLAENSFLVKEENVSSYSNSLKVVKEKAAVESINCCGSGKVESSIEQQKYGNHWPMEEKTFDQIKQGGSNLIVDSSDSRSRAMSHLEAINFVSPKNYEVLEQDVHETNAIHCHHAGKSRCSSSTLPHETIFDSQPEDAVKFIKQDSVLMMREDVSNTTHDADHCKTEKAEIPTAFSREDDENIMINPVYNDHVLFEDKSFESMKYERQNFPNSDSILWEFKRREILGSNAPVHTRAEQAYHDDCGSYHLLDKCSLTGDSSCSLFGERAATKKREGVLDLETRLNVVSELNQSDIITMNGDASQYDDAVVSNNVEQFQIDASLSNVKGMICVQGGDCFIDSKARLGESLETRKYYESVELCSLRTEESVGANTIENQILSEKAETRAFSGMDYPENENIKAVDKKILYEHHTGDNKSLVACGNANAEFSQPPEVQITTLVADHSCDENNETCLIDCTLLSEGISKESCSGESVDAVDTEADKIKCISPADIERNNGQMNKSLVMEYQHDKDISSYTEDAKTTLSTKRPGDDGMFGNLLIKPPPNAVPFSEEWLAAMEAAGEEILTMKSGAVQNSPTDKALPEPSPWSPVKRKQNQIGPYDCTKFINVPPNSD